ncbi:hypothetical protein PR048_022389 [Dryococelus australis]|uniref:Uncharacterized protein n=1 Tax=Dryococelus australis TaxID=614101 RepID=A0ABQ9H0Z0_9NEOP|nr:hypothetical protein PR048_022389 [Dryococelus australis]
MYFCGAVGGDIAPDWLMKNSRWCRGCLVGLSLWQNHIYPRRAQHDTTKTATTTIFNPSHTRADVICLLAATKVRTHSAVLLSYTELRGRSGVVVRLLASHLGKPDSFPGGVAPGFSQMGNVTDDAADRRVFLGISRLTRPFIPVLLHTPLTSRPSALKTSLLRAARISSLHSTPLNLNWSGQTNFDEGTRLVAQCVFRARKLLATTANTKVITDLMSKERRGSPGSNQIIELLITFTEVLLLMMMMMMMMMIIKYNGAVVVRALASHLCDPGSIPDGFPPGFSHVGIVLDDTACRRVFSGYSLSPRPCIPAPLHLRVMSWPGMRATHGSQLENPSLGGCRLSLGKGCSR